MKILTATLVAIAILCLDEQIDELRHEIDILNMKIAQLEAKK